MFVEVSVPVVDSRRLLTYMYVVWADTAGAIEGDRC